MIIESLKTLVSNDGAKFLEGECLDKTLFALSDNKAYLVDGSPTKENVPKLLMALNARLKTSAHTNVHICGLRKTIDNLMVLNSSSVPTGYGFISNDGAGKVYLCDLDKVLVGAIFVPAGQ
jgi:hypothetical protein